MAKLMWLNEAGQKSRQLENRTENVHMPPLKGKAMSDVYEFTGKIVTVINKGRQAIVQLDETCGKQKLALITEATDGRVELMNGTGKLIENCRVTGKAAASHSRFQSLQVNSVSEERNNEPEAIPEE